MKIYTKIVGKKSYMNPIWKVEKDQWGSTFITNTSMKQKLRLTKNIAESTKEDIDYSTPDDSLFTISENVVPSVSNKNLNISIIPNKYNENSKTYNNLCYFVVYGYRITGYKLQGSTKIIQTFSGGYKNFHRGCCLNFNNIDTTLLTVKVKKYKDSKEEIFDVKVEDGVIEFVPHEVTNPETEDIGWENVDRFYVTTKIGVIPTACILVNSATEPENKLVDEVAECVKDVKNAAIVPLPGNGTFEPSNFTEEEYKGIEAALDKALTEERNRAVTIVGLKNIPKEFFKKYRILYVFELDPSTGYILNTKSN